LVVVAACGANGTSTPGKRGRATFNYWALPGCTDGCNLDQYFLAPDGAKQTVRVNGVAFAGVQSSAPQVAGFVGASGEVEATTGMPGDADLVLLDGAGGELDRVTVHVAATAQLEFTRGWQGDGPILVENVPITSFQVRKRDAVGRILLGAGAVRFTVGGTLSSLGAPPPPGPGLPPNMVETLIVQGQAGAGDLAGANGGQSFDIPVTTVALTDLEKLTLAAGATTLGEGGIPETALAATAATKDGLAYGWACAWAVSDSSVQVKIGSEPDHLDVAPVENARFRLTRTGSYTASCTVGRLTAMVTLSRSD
jgi:hypothetical protein